MRKCRILKYVASIALTAKEIEKESGRDRENIYKIVFCSVQCNTMRISQPKNNSECIADDNRWYALGNRQNSPPNGFQYVSQCICEIHEVHDKHYYARRHRHSTSQYNFLHSLTASFGYGVMVIKTRLQTHQQNPKRK